MIFKKNKTLLQNKEEFDAQRKLGEVIDTGAKAVEVLAPIAQAVAPLTGSNAAAVSAGAAVANELAKKVDAAIPDKAKK